MKHSVIGLWSALALATIFPSFAFAQAVAPAPPSLGPDALEHYRRSTISIGQIIQKDGIKQYVTVGSGVIVAIDSHHGVLITAKHVVFEPSKGYVPTSMRIRLPKNTKDDAVDFGIDVPLSINGKNLWQSLPDGSDIAAVPLPDLSGYRDINGIGLDQIGGEAQTYQGASLIILGYPAVAGENFLTTPLARAGIISWTDPKGASNNRFLIDANIFNGNSGGPVFSSSAGLSRSGGFQIGGVFLVGIVVEDAIERAPIKIGNMPLSGTNPQTGNVEQAFAEVLNIGGIGVVEPASKVLALVKQFFAAEK